MNEPMNNDMREASRGLTERLQEFAQPALDWTAQALSSLFAPLDSFLSGLDPESAGRWCAVGLFAIAALWVFTLKRDYIYQGAPDRAIWRDLRWWSVAALAPYVFIYLFLF